ncbi:MAG: SlyX family protein [Pseudomonadota bacterium]
MNDVDRLTATETKLAYLEDAVDTLSDVVIKQREMLDSLLRQLTELSDRLDAAGAGTDPNGDERPPHY